MRISRQMFVAIWTNDFILINVHLKRQLKILPLIFSVGGCLLVMAKIDISANILADKGSLDNHKLQWDAYFVNRNVC